jgi:ABC-type sulfate transport system substrate-binding protein
MSYTKILFAAAGLLALLGRCTPARAAAQTILNVSYNPTREFYADYDAAFEKDWKAKARRDVAVNLSNGGSGKQPPRSPKEELATCCCLGRTRPTLRLSSLAPANSKSFYPSSSILAEPPVALVAGTSIGMECARWRKATISRAPTVNQQRFM